MQDTRHMDGQAPEDTLIANIRHIAEAFGPLTERAVSIYAPMVEDLLWRNVQDVKEIGHLLDSMFAFCPDDRILQLYRRLCRHLYFIDAAAAMDYVNMYREYYDNNEADDGEGDSKYQGQPEK